MHRLDSSGAVALVIMMALCLLAVSSSVCADEVERARALTDEGWWDEAEALLLELLDSDESNPEIHNNLAEIYMNRLMRGEDVDWGEMEGHAKKAVELDGTSASYYLTLGNVLGLEARHGSKLRAMGRAKNGRKAIEKVLELEPDNLDARDWLFQYYFQAPGFAGGDKGKARDQAREIARVDSVEGFLYWAFIYEFDEEDFEAAEAEFLKAFAADPRVAEPYFSYAYFLSRRGEHDKAQATAAELLGREWIDDETRARVHVNLGYMHQGNGEWDSAIAEFSEVLEVDPTDMQAVYQMGRTYIFAETNLDEAERLFKLYLDQVRLKGYWPSKADAHYRLANVYFLKGEKGMAKEEVEEALKLDPDHDGAKDLKRDIIYGRK